jgi:hypothetical protein
MDCFNESLNSLRPFGVRGLPLAWKIDASRLQGVLIDYQNLEKLLGIAIAKVLKHSSYLCGFFQERFNEEYLPFFNVDQIREERLTQLIENEIVENEENWTYYQEEETHV